MMRTLSLLVLVLLAAAPVSAQPLQMLPADEVSADPTWMRFRMRLLEALEKRDQRYLMSVLDPRVRNTSGTPGAAEFAKVWDIKAVDSTLWAELRKVLFLGGVQVKRERSTEFCAPYVYYKWPEGADPDVGAALIAREVLVKQAPAAGSPTLATASYHVVKVLDWEVEDVDKSSLQKWVRIETAGGSGYVPDEQIRSPLEYRACFVKRGTTWRMTALEAGE